MLVLELSLFSASVLMAVTMRVKFSSLPAGGVMTSPFSCSAERVQEPSPLSLPAERTAPLGRLLMTKIEVSEPSRSSSWWMMFSPIGWSTSPEALSARRTTPSATAATSTGTLKLVTLVWPESDSVLVTSKRSVKSLAESCGGVTVSPFISVWLRVQVPSPLSVPAESRTPDGTSRTRICKEPSEPSRSPPTTERSRAMAISSLPTTGPATTFASSATPLMTTGNW